MKTSKVFKCCLIVFCLAAMLLADVSAFALPGDTCNPPGKAKKGKINCDGDCIKNKTINKELGNGDCDESFNCAAFLYDYGDCAQSSTDPGAPCKWNKQGKPTKYYDCDGTCRKSGDFSKNLGNGSCDSFLNCDEWNYDDGDCASDCYKDADGDGYGAGLPIGTSPCGAGQVENNGDCDDGNVKIHPFATETCNGIDENCDGVPDDGLMVTYYYDGDGDGYGVVDTSFDTCGAPPANYVPVYGDCDDEDPAVHPGATETCNDVDDDCNGDVDDGLPTTTYYSDADGDGYGDPHVYLDDCNPPANYVADNTDCDDNNANIHPGAYDICDNGIDEDCSSGIPVDHAKGDRDCSETPSICANLSNVPLETQVTSAQPIVMLLVDDSGSMAWSTLCPEDNGEFGGYRDYDDVKNYWHSQWNGYNGVYYDPDLTYTPWPDSTSYTLKDADIDKPRYHPRYTSTRDLDDKFWSGGGLNVYWSHFYVWSSKATCPYLVNMYESGGNYYMKYYRVTCYSDCSDTYSQIKSFTYDSAPPGDVVSGRSAKEERQNFANWFQYYRTRQLTALSALSSVVTSVSAMKIGIHTINHSVNMVKPREVDTDQGDILDDLYKVGASGGTPLRRGLEAIGDYFDDDANGPYDTSGHGGECQQAFTIMMTDGYYNGSDPGVGNADGNNDTDFDGAPFGDAYKNTLADVAMYYYERDLNSNLADDVPTSALDQASHQHMVTYSVSFGLEGRYNPDDYNCPTTSCPPWPYVDENSEDENSITDLWHAAVNGRGRYMEATNAQQLAYILKTMLEEVSERRGTGASVAVNTQTLEENTMMYQGSYNSAGWTGELDAYSIDDATATVATTPTWSAAQKLDEMVETSGHSVRNIWTMGASGGMAFTTANYDLGLFTTEQEGDLGLDATARKNLINYIRGDMSNDTLHGGSMRARATRLGDIVHSAPVHVGDYLYVGGNDGMLHVFDATNGATGGREVLAYIPSFVYPNLEQLANPEYSHRYYVDQTPFVGYDDDDAGNDVLLIGGLGKGGKGYFCLDLNVSPKAGTLPGALDDPGTFTGSDVRWEYPNVSSSTDDWDNMGYSFSEATIVATDDSHDHVAIFGNGYDSVNGRAVLYVVDLATGATLTTIDTEYGNSSTLCNGLSTPTFVDTDSDGKVNYAYAGDLQGNLWKFDLTGPVSTWRVAYNVGGTPAPLFQARDTAGNPQPIVIRPSVQYHCEDDYSGYIVVFGTGKFNAAGDFASTSTQSIYGIWDWAAEWENAAAAQGVSVTVDDKSLGAYHDPGSDQLSNIVSLDYVGPDLTLLNQSTTATSATVNGTEWHQTSSAGINWFDIKTYLKLVDEGQGSTYGDNGEGFDVGWSFTLTQPRERIVADILLRQGMALVTSLVPSDSMCETGGHSNLYALSSCSGAAPENAFFDINRDGVISQGDGIDNDGDGLIDEPDEAANDGIDNDGDGLIDEADERYDLIKGSSGHYVPPNNVELNDIYYRPTIIEDESADQALIVYGATDPTDPTGASSALTRIMSSPTGVVYWRFFNIN